MKLATFMFLSALGMGATSTAVAFATGPAAADEEPAAWAPAEGPRADPVAAATTTEPAAAPPGWFVAEGTLTLEGRLGHAALAADRSAETHLLVQVAAPASERAGSAPANLSIVIDRSGSMKGARMNNALAAARGMIAGLRDGDSVSVVAYDGRATTLLPPTIIDASTRALIPRALAGIRAGGNTCISCGVELGLELLAQRSGAVDRMLLLSDGEANRGVTNVPSFRALATGARDRGVAISSIGVDLEYNQVVLSELARWSDGNHHFVEDPRRLTIAFEQELTSLLGTVAEDAEVEVALAPGVKLLEVVDRGYFPTKSGSVRVPLGAFSVGTTKTVLLHLRVDADEVGDRPVADVRLAFDDRVVGTPSRLEGELVARFAGADDPQPSSDLDPIVEARIARSETAAALELANQSLAQDDAKAALAIIERTRSALKKRKRKASVLAAAPPAVARDLDDQLRALDNANRGINLAVKASSEPNPFPARTAPRPKDTTAGRRAIRSNQEAANPFNF